MKLDIILKSMLLFCLIVSTTVQAQYQPPSQDQVEELLEQIDKCKKEITKTEKQIAYMEKNAESFTLAQYNNAKDLIDRIKTCLSINRGKLATLKKEYPGWFNAPNAVVQLGKGKEITPHDLEEQIDAISDKIKRVLDRLKALEEPEH